MQWLDAGLAFAITMLMLSMVVSTIVETLHRIVGMRESGLRQMLGELFDAVLARYSDLAGTGREAFIKAIVDNRAPTPLTTGDPSSWLGNLWNGRGLSEISLQSFMERLGSSALGLALLRDVERGGVGTVDVALHDLAQKFEAFGDDASVFFERRARLVAVLVSLVVGVLFYVHPYEMMRTYLQDKAVRDAVIATQQKVLDAYEAGAKAEAEAAKAKAEAAKAKAEAANPPEPAKPSEAKSPEATTSVEDLTKTTMKKVQADIQAMQGVGAPIGWIGDKWPSGADGWTNVTTLAWLILGGLLVGLGGPFWYDTIGSLSNLRELLQPAKSPAPSSGVAPKPREAAVEAFKIAAGARHLSADPEIDPDVPVG